jgi:thiamine kinase-like enzyme
LDGVYAALARVPLFGGLRREVVKLERLGSLTNASYKVTTNGGVYVLRLPGKGTSDYIDRTAEEHNARVAAAAGINAEVLFFDAGDGLMLSRFIEGATMDEARLNGDPGALARAALALRKIHYSGRAFESRFDVFAKIGYYLALLLKLRAPLPEEFDEISRGAEAVRRALESSPIPLAPCHNDAWPRNFLDTGGHAYIIDWEYSGMNDPMWDLGDLSVEAGFGAEQDRILMETYCGGRVPPALYARLELYKTMSDLLWAVWGLVQHANGNPREDFRAYALERLEDCKTRMGDGDFGRHLAMARADHQLGASRAHHQADLGRKSSVRGASRRVAHPNGPPPSPLPSTASAPPSSATAQASG